MVCKLRNGLIRKIGYGSVMPLPNKRNWAELRQKVKERRKADLKRDPERLRDRLFAMGDLALQSGNPEHMQQTIELIRQFNRVILAHAAEARKKGDIATVENYRYFAKRNAEAITHFKKEIEYAKKIRQN